MPIDEKLATALNFAALVALITSAVHDDSPRLSLGDIYHLITNTGSSSLLVRPLNTLPHLISSNDTSAKDIVSLIGECGSAKEVVMAVQESEEEETTKASLPAQLVCIRADLIGVAISRLKLRRKSASETIQNTLEDFENAVTLAGQFCSRKEGISLLDSSSRLAEKVAAWVKVVAGEDDAAVSRCYKMLESFVCGVLTACSHCVRTSIAQRTFEQCFPKLTFRSAVEPGWEEDEKAVQEVIRVLWLLGCTIDDFVKRRSQSSLIILAHSPANEMENKHVLTSLSPAITASVQANMNIGESIALLLKLLHLPSTRDELSLDVVAPLTIILPPLASTHPDPLVRHQVFRTLSKLLSICPSNLRNPDFPQMRVASVGLVKEAVMEALSAPEPASEVFASPLLLKTFGPVLLRPIPPIYFRIHYRDIGNVVCFILVLMTGVRDKDALLSVERGLLAPLRSTLDNWMSQPDVSTDDIHANMSLASLQMSLERVDTAVASLQ
ncbi:hypothetical protein BDQ17DRAFT_1392937 [Cyathus striatus]|nr:hypothetical protein BDQ17DRAFT_1392937 [Cyathus striatus]